MIKVKIQKSGQTLVGYTVKGHAGYAQRGQDIVCAGVSAIAQAGLMGLQDILEDNVKAELKEGCLTVAVDYDNAVQPGVASILRVVELGLSSIAKTHPDFVNVDYGS